MKWAIKVVTLVTLFVAVSAPAQSETRPWVVRTADHAGFWEGDHVRWRSQYELRSEARKAFDELRFVRPVDGTVVEVAPESVSLIRDPEGRATGVRFPDREPAPWNITLVVRQPVGEAGRLKPPLLGSTAPHRVALRGAKFTPADGSALRVHPGFVATEGVDRDGRRRIDASFEEPPPKADRPVYFRPMDLEGAALPGRVESVAAHKRRTVWVLGVVLVALVGLGAGAYRWLDGRAKEEEAEAILAEHDIEFDL